MTQLDKKIIATWPSREVKILECHLRKKIADFSPKDFNKLEEKLLLVQRAIGVGQLIGDLEMEWLIESFTRELTDFSIEEILYAIELLSYDHLEVEKRHFQAFTALYLNPVFAAYRKLRFSVLNKYYKAEDKIRELEIKTSTPGPTPEQVFLSKKNLTLSAFENFKSSITIMGLPQIFDFLWDLRLIPFDKNQMLNFEVLAALELKLLAKQGGIDRINYDSYCFYLKHEKGGLTNKKNNTQYETCRVGYNAIVNKTKECAVKKVFVDFQVTEIDLSEHIEQANNQLNEKLKENIQIK